MYRSFQFHFNFIQCSQSGISRSNKSFSLPKRNSKLCQCLTQLCVQLKLCLFKRILKTCLPENKAYITLNTRCHRKLSVSSWRSAPFSCSFYSWTWVLQQKVSHQTPSLRPVYVSAKFSRIGSYANMRSKINLDTSVMTCP